MKCNNNSRCNDNADYDVYGCTHYVNDDGDLVEVTKVICLECENTGVIEVIHPKPVWKDANQTKLTLVIE